MRADSLALALGNTNYPNKWHIYSIARPKEKSDTVKGKAEKILTIYVIM